MRCEPTIHAQSNIVYIDIRRLIYINHCDANLLTFSEQDDANRFNENEYVQEEGVILDIV